MNQSTILVVDDEAHMRRLIRYVLEAKGYKVMTASDGKEALAQLDQQAPDLMICDAMMPSLDGYATVETLRRDLRWQALPVLMLTARGQEKDRRRAEEVGVTSYITKPFSSAELAGTVAKFIRPLFSVPGNPTPDRYPG